MRLLINTASTHKGGGVQVANSLIEEFRNFPENEYHIVLGIMLQSLIKKETFNDNFYFYSIGARPASSIQSMRNAKRFLNTLIDSINPDVVLTTSGPSYWKTKKPHVMGFNLGHFVYSDSPFYKSISLIQKVKWNIKFLSINYFYKRDADAVVVQTDDVKNRLQIKWPEKKIYTVSNTVNEIYINPLLLEKKLPPGRTDEFRLLTISAWYQHKNLTIIKKVIDGLSSGLLNRIRFALTLPYHEYETHFDISYRKYIYNVGPVKPEEGPSLYSECDAMFLPTLLECFSASYAEAMAMKKPILTSDLGFAHTVCDDAALYFDPMNPQSIIDAITLLVDNDELQNTLIEKGIRRLKYFGTAQQRAEQYLDICKEAIHGN